MCYNDVAIADNVLTFTTVAGDIKEITLPSRTNNIYDLTTYYETISFSYTPSSKAYLYPTNVSGWVNSDNTKAVKYLTQNSNSSSYQQYIKSATISAINEDYCKSFITNALSNVDNITVSGQIALVASIPSNKPPTYGTLITFSATKTDGVVDVTTLTLSSTKYIASASSSEKSEFYVMLLVSSITM